MTAFTLSDLIKGVATKLGWKDTSYYGDTDYGLTQTFELGSYGVRIRIEYAAAFKGLGKAEKPLKLIVDSEYFNEPMVREWEGDLLTPKKPGEDVGPAVTAILDILDLGRIAAQNDEAWKLLERAERGAK